MPFLAKEHHPVPTKDLLSWVGIEIRLHIVRPDVNIELTMLFALTRPLTTWPTIGTIL